MKKEKKQAIVFWLSLITTVVAILALIALVAAQAYIRWKLNQNFTFLGEAGVPSFAGMATVLTVALAYIHRQER